MSISERVDASAATWEPFGQPIRECVPDGAAPWRDNTWLCFWDLAAGVFGEFHVSTSPNGGGCRARCSVVLNGNGVHVVEEPRPGTFTSESIDFSELGRVSARSDRLTLDLQVTPLFALADYSLRNTLPSAAAGEPLHHYQRAAAVTGAAVMDGRAVRIEGVGFRDRTWGYRDEAASWAEYVGLNAVFADFAVTSVRLRGTDNSSSLEGYVLRHDGAGTEVTSMTVARDACGLFAGSALELTDGTLLDLRPAAEAEGFWVPLGKGGTGPTMSSYAAFFPISTADGVHGVGRFEQGILRTLY